MIENKISSSQEFSFFLHDEALDYKIRIVYIKKSEREFNQIIGNVLITFSKSKIIFSNTKREGWGSEEKLILKKCFLLIFSEIYNLEEEVGEKTFNGKFDSCAPSFEIPLRRKRRSYIFAVDFKPISMSPQNEIKSNKKDCL